MYYRAKLLDQSVDQSEAEIVVQDTAQGVQYAVNTDNQKMKMHIEKVLSTEFYSISPGYTSNKESTVCVLQIPPYSREQALLIPEILGWKGYSVEKGDILKSSLIEDFLVFKSGTEITNNAAGERIVKRVPKGMIAVADDGRVVAGGKRLNANIDKPDATWRLVNNPYEAMTPDERASEHSDYEFGFNDYHPGFQEELYKGDANDENPSYHNITDDFEIPDDAPTLQEFYSKSDFGILSGEEVNTPEELPSHLPVSIQDGYILYSPEAGYALPSSSWPPLGLSGFHKLKWYAFEAPETEDPDDLRDFAEAFGMKPNLIPGATKKLVHWPEDLDVEDGILIRLVNDTGMASDDFKIVDIDVNMPLKRKTTFQELNSSENQEATSKIRNYIDSVKEYTSYRETPNSYPGLAPNINEMEVEDLTGGSASFQLSLRPEQKPVVNAITNTGNYEKWGGPTGQHGYYLNLIYGAGKTAIVCAADAMMRNRGHFKNGEQTTLITAPSKNIFVWQSEIAKFRAEGAIVISGSKGERISQWEEVVRRAKDGELPNFLIVAASKFRLGNEVVIEDEEEKKEIDMDAQFMRLLALGGTANGSRIRGGHIAALTLDETSQYVNPESARYKAAREIAESVYYGKGITWMLNGDLSDNSATDTITQLSLVNNIVRNNFEDAVKAWTIKDTNRPNSNTRVWNVENGGLIDFNEKFGHTIYTLDGKMIAGDEYGLSFTSDMELPLGRNWGDVYNDVMDKMEVLLTNGTKGQATKALGMLSLLVNTSFGAIQPARLLEYDVGTEVLLAGVKDILEGELYDSFREELRTFLLSTTEESLAGRTPKDRMKISDRDNAYNHTFSDISKQAMISVLDSWDNPVLDGILDGIKEAIDGCEPGQNIKLGIAGFSKRAIQTLYRRLRNEYEDHSVLIQKFDGDTESELINEQMQKHQEEDSRHVISLVTGAGLYGLSLPANRSWRFTTWNPAKAGQYTGRFHRNPRQPHIATVVVPRGVCEYMREIEDKKRVIQNTLKSELIDIEIDDLDDDATVRTGSSLSKLIDKLKAYRPEILTRERADAS